MSPYQFPHPVPTDPILSQLAAAVCLHRDDDTPRLAYADRLQELSRGERKCTYCRGKGRRRRAGGTFPVTCTSCDGRMLIPDVYAIHAALIRGQVAGTIPFPHSESWEAWYRDDRTAPYRDVVAWWRFLKLLFVGYDPTFTFFSPVRGFPQYVQGSYRGWVRFTTLLPDLWPVRHCRLSTLPPVEVALDWNGSDVCRVRLADRPKRPWMDYRGPRGETVVRPGRRVQTRPSDRDASQFALARTWKNVQFIVTRDARVESAPSRGRPLVEVLADEELDELCGPIE